MLPKRVAAACQSPMSTLRSRPMMDAALVARAGVAATELDVDALAITAEARYRHRAAVASEPGPPFR